MFFYVFCWLRLFFRSGKGGRSEVFFFGEEVGFFGWGWVLIVVLGNRVGRGVLCLCEGESG